jgi:hypothetical protein
MDCIYNNEAAFLRGSPHERKRLCSLRQIVVDQLEKVIDFIYDLFGLEIGFVGGLSPYRARVFCLPCPSSQPLVMITAQC